MKKTLLLGIGLVVTVSALIFIPKHSEKEKKQSTNIREDVYKIKKGKKKTLEERAMYSEERAKHEFKLQVNPNTGEIPLNEKKIEFKNAQKAKKRSDFPSDLRAPDATFINRGPTNLGGRTRALVVDRSDPTGNTIIAGGVSSGVFRTTNGGTSWTKVSANDEIHNVSTIVQDPRAGFENTWYYGTGEGSGNSTSLAGAYYAGQGIWRSTDGGLNWTQLSGTSSTEPFNSRFDIVFNLAIQETTGDLYAAIAGRIMRYNGTTWSQILTNTGSTYNSNDFTDIAITSGGRVFASFSGNQDASIEGVWSSANGTSGWSRINETAPGVFAFTPAGRVVIGLSGNDNKLYVLYVNGTSSSCTGIAAPEADLWMWNQSGTSWTNYSSKLPDETGCSNGNDPLAVQGGYDLVVSVKPDNEDFVVIGGTNAYKIADIVNNTTFTRIGGYNGPSGYAIYDTPGGDEHHPDIHALVFNPFNYNILFSGTDGGVHRTDDITAGTIDWTSLNNNYQTQQFYHVAIDPQSGSDFVLGGLQDNGTNQGGTSAGQPNLTVQERVTGGDGVAVAISRDDAVNIPTFVGAQNGTIYRRNKNLAPGYINANIRPSGSQSQFVTYFKLDQDNNNTLYYAGRGVLYRTTNSTNVTSSVGAGATDWTNMGTAPVFSSANEWISTFSTSWGAYNAGSSYLLMGGDTGHILRLDDPQNAASATSAVDITPPGATTTYPSVVTGLAIHPSNPDIVLATYANYGITNIFLTTNATSATPTWTVVERNLSSHSIRSAAIVEVSGETMYVVGTARGLYSSTDPTSVDWVREAPNQIGYAVVSSMAYRPADNKLLIGTHGNGMYEATITQVLSIDENDISDSMIVYPNPAKADLFINLPNNLNTKASYTINNILGQTISKGSLENDRIDVSNLRTGIYFIQVSADGLKGTKKFIKQ